MSIRRHRCRSDLLILPEYLSPDDKSSGFEIFSRANLLPDLQKRTKFRCVRAAIQAALYRGWCDATSARGARDRIEKTTVDAENVTLKVAFLMKTASTDYANALRFLAALELQMTFQTALVPVGPFALVARVRLRDDDPWNL